MRSLRDIFDLFPKSRDVGLTGEEVAQSREKFGANRLTPLPREPVWKKFLEKFDDSIIKILLAASLLKIVVDLFEASTTVGAIGLAAVVLLLIGALIGKLGGFLQTTPAGIPGLLQSLDADYFRRMEAVEFAVKNDDGAEPRNLPKADLVLVGVSRTSKTPLSTYLAQRGLKVANVPLVLGVDPPAELEQVDDSRVYGLVIQTDTLRRIRQQRLKLWLQRTANTTRLTAEQQQGRALLAPLQLGGIVDGLHASSPLSLVMPPGAMG